MTEQILEQLKKDTDTDQETMSVTGGRHSTALRTQPARVRVTALDFFSGKISDVAVLIDSALLREWTEQKKLNKVDRIHPALVKSSVAKKNQCPSSPIGKKKEWCCGT